MVQGAGIAVRGKRAASGNLRAKFEGRCCRWREVCDFGVELLVDGGCGLAWCCDGDGAVFDLKLVRCQGAEHVVAVGCRWRRGRGWLVGADQGGLWRVD